MQNIQQNTCYELETRSIFNNNIIQLLRLEVRRWRFRNFSQAKPWMYIEHNNDIILVVADVPHR